jgi:hypothetical protein
MYCCDNISLFVFFGKKHLKLVYCVEDNLVRTYKCSVLVVSVGRRIILSNPYGPSRICGPSARYEACSHIRAHRSDQGAPADHPERRERVSCTHREKPKTGLVLRTRERMVLCQLVFYKILIESDLQVSTLEWLEEIVLNTNIGNIIIFGYKFGRWRWSYRSVFPCGDYYCNMAGGRGKRSWS